MRSRASASANHAARSTSGNSRCLPERGGHSIVNVFERIASASASPASAQAVTTLPLRWRTSPRSTSSPSGGGEPSSSANSRSAHARASSPSSYSPLGIDQAPASFFAQNGPPGWTSSTSRSPSRRRWSRIPALRLPAAIGDGCYFRVTPAPPRSFPCRLSSTSPEEGHETMRRTRLIGAIACAVGALSVLPAAAPAAVQDGSSGWLWGNPLPQGNTIRAMSFAGSQGYASGDFGTLLHTTDAGATWTGLPSGTFTNLTEVQAIDGAAVFAGGGCVARRSDDGGATFKRLAFTPVESSCREQLAGGWFVNRVTGYLVLTDGTVLRTDNDGDTFAQKNAVPGTRAQGGNVPPTELVFLSDAVGFAATGDGRIFRTVDGATSWALVRGASGRAIRSIAFVDGLHGVAAGDAGQYLTTADGGVTWTPVDLGVGALDLSSVRCMSTARCVATTTRGDQLVRVDSTEAGPRLVTPAADPILAAAFASPTRIVVGGATGATAISDDAGRTFTSIGGRLTGRFLRIRAGGQGGAAFAPGAD